MELSIKAKSKLKRWSVRFIIVLASSGILFTAYYLFLVFTVHNFWDIEVEGISNLKTQDIRQTSLMILKKTNASSVTTEIEEALKMNPRIKNANVHILPNRKLHIQIVENKSEFLVQSNHHVSEFSDDEKIIQESIQDYLVGFEPEIPVFYLTSHNGIENKALIMSPAIHIKGLPGQIFRNILDLYRETKTEFAFLWQRISEIEIYTDAGDVYCSFYPSTVRAKIQIFYFLDRSTLTRLWATLYFLEKTGSNGYSHVDLQTQNAIIREI